MDSLHRNRRFEGRPRKIIPLHESRARHLQGNDFRFGLHALHHQLDVQLPAQPDRMNNNGPPRLIRVAILHHRAVQLHRVGLQIRKPGQAGKTAAEIIHGNLEAVEPSASRFIVAVPGQIYAASKRTVVPT